MLVSQLIRYYSMLRDVEFFESRLGKIDGFEDAGEHLTNIIKSKEVKEVKTAAAPTPAPAAAATADAEGKQSSEASSDATVTDANNGTAGATEDTAA